MEKEILINNNCISCMRCMRVCPAGVFGIEPDTKPKRPFAANPQICIKCGHCAAVCENSSLQHSLFPPEKVHNIDYSLYPSQGQFELLIKARRSNRAFSKESIPLETLYKIAEAANRAPTASNSQSIHYTLIKDTQKLKCVIEFTMEAFSSLLKKIDNVPGRLLLKCFMPDAAKYIPMFREMQKEYAEGKDFILRNATALLLIHAPAKNMFGSEDCNLAYQNASLMAECMGVSQFYTGFVLRAIKMNKGKLEKLLGINGVIHAGLALGMPSFRYPNYIDREPLEIKIM